MKHFKHKKRIIISLITALIVVLFIIGWIDVNSRFPQPQEELYAVDEWMPYSDDIQIRAKSIEYCSVHEFNQKYKQKRASDKDNVYIVVQLEVSNASNQAMDVIHIAQQFVLAIYPIGYVNQGEIIADTPVLAANTTEEKTICFIVTEGLIQGGRRETAFKNDVYLYSKSYPIRRAIVFKSE